MEADSEEQQLKCHFLELPAELRNRIYRMCLVASDAVIEVEFKDLRRWSSARSCSDWSASLPPEPLFLSTCKTIRNEALSIYYGENTFHLALPSLSENHLIVWGVESSQGVAQDKIKITLEQHGNNEFGNAPRSLCACELHGKACSRRFRNGKGSLVFNLVKRFTEKYENEISDHRCSLCGCPELYRIID
ncbi:hypothetical protein BST61_g11578 [Cercospora zeina]